MQTIFYSVQQLLYQKYCKIGSFRECFTNHYFVQLLWKHKWWDKLRKLLSIKSLNSQDLLNLTPFDLPKSWLPNTAIFTSRAFKIGIICLPLVTLLTDEKTDEERHGVQETIWQKRLNLDQQIQSLSSSWFRHQMLPLQMGRKSKQGQNWVSNQVFIDEVVVRDKISLAPEPHLRCYTLFYETVENGWPVPNRESWNHFLFYGRHTYPRGEMTAICELRK